MTKYYTFEIVIEKELDDPGYFAYCPALRGCVTSGETIEETRANMQEALELHIESLIAHGDPIPEDSVRIVEKLEVGVAA